MLTCVILTATEGSLKHLRFSFEGREQVLIGRDRSCALRLDDPTVSRRHCLIAGGEVARVRDLGSLNGTFVNGQRVGGRHEPRDTDTEGERTFRELHDGDRLQVGTWKFWVRLEVIEEECPSVSQPCAV